MTIEEALIKVKEGAWFLEEYPEWNDDEAVVLASVQYIGTTLRFASNRLREDKEVILTAIQSNTFACKYSLLKGYKKFNDIVEKEVEDFLFSFWNNHNLEARLQVANHPNFLPPLEQIEIGLQDSNRDVRQVYQLRQDEWSSKIEENKLRNTL